MKEKSKPAKTTIAMFIRYYIISGVTMSYTNINVIFTKYFILKLLTLTIININNNHISIININVHIINNI